MAYDNNMLGTVFGGITGDPGLYTLYLLAIAGAALFGILGFKLWAWIRRDRSVEKAEAKLAAAKAAAEVLSEEVATLEDKIESLRSETKESECWLEQLTEEKDIAKEAVAKAEEVSIAACSAAADAKAAEAKLKAEKAEARKAYVIKALTKVADIVMIPVAAVGRFIRRTWFKGVGMVGLVSRKELDSVLALQEKLDIARLQISCLSDKQTRMEMKMHDLEEELSRKETELRDGKQNDPILDMFKAALEQEEKMSDQKTERIRELDAELLLLQVKEKEEKESAVCLGEGYSVSFRVSEAITLAAVEAALLKKAELKGARNVFNKLRIHYSVKQPNRKKGMPVSKCWQEIFKEAKAENVMNLPIKDIIAMPGQVL